MPKSNLPTYAIVELLMRLELFNNAVGSYKDHSILDETVKVKTTGGVIFLTKELVMRQFKDPGLVTDKDLLDALPSFNPGQKEPIKIK